MGTVSLCMICKNEELNIAALLDDVCPVLEEVHITDTGSTDNTLKILKDKQDAYQNLFVHHYAWNSHFSDARNFSFSKAGDTEWILWLDCDDRIDSKDLKYFKDNVLVQRKDVDMWMLPYVYNRHPNGTPSLILSRGRFVRKAKDPKWAGAIHEYISTGSLKQADYQELKVEHHRGNKVMEDRRNLKILKRECELDPSEPRNAYYYGKELFDWGELAEAKPQLLHYLNLPCWRFFDDEIGARFRLAKIFLHEKNWDEALRAIEPAYRLDSTRRRAEFYYILGEVEYYQKKHDIAVEWYKRCLCEPPGSPRVIQLLYWRENPLVRITECLRDLGRWDDIAEYVPKLKECGTERALHWLSVLFSYLPVCKSSPEVVLEFGTKMLPHSLKINEEPYMVQARGYNPFEVSKWQMTKTTPFLDNTVDGIIIDRNSYPNMDINELISIVKDGGFIWSTLEIKHFNLIYVENISNIFKYKNDKKSNK